MTRVFGNRWFLRLLRIAIGGLFIYAGLQKIGTPLQFADSIATFKVLPPELINLVALALPPFEILVGGLLLFGAFVRPAAFALVGLDAVFIVLLLQAIARGLEVDCGCFGSGEPSRWAAWLSLGRNLMLLVGCWWVYRLAANFPLPSAIGKLIKPLTPKDPHMSRH